jgi:hypothetical protein
MKLKSIFLSLLACLVLIGERVEAKTLYAILVADSIHDITMITKPDVRRLQQELKVVATHTKVDLKTRIFSDREFRMDKLIGYLQSLKVNSDDLVVFYFSGHGYRYSQQKSPWPNMMFDPRRPGINLEYIAKLVWNKKPQFALIMSDCCNNNVEQGFFGNASKSIDVRLRKKTPYFPGYHDLFTNAKGCVVVCSCSAGQFSYGSSCGGLFTQSFLVSLNHELGQQSPNWTRLIQRASSYINHIQKPVCQFYD